MNHDTQPAYEAMLSALRFALPFMEDLANSSSKNERRAVRLMRDAIAAAESEQ